MVVLDALNGTNWIVLFMFLGVLGAAAGFLSGLLGVGGGIVLVPALFYGFGALGFESDTLMHTAVGTSLAIIIVNGLSSTRAHWQKGAVDPALVWRIGLGIVPGTFIGTVLAGQMGGPALQLTFACALVALSILMVVNPARIRLFGGAPHPLACKGAGLAIGALSTMIGVGGATLSVPYMSLSGTPLRKAIGTAAALGLVISVPATCGFILIGLGEAGRPPFSLGFVNIPAWLCIIPISMLTAPAGAGAAHKVRVDFLRTIFACFMSAVALKMWMDIL